MDFNPLQSIWIGEKMNDASFRPQTSSTNTLVASSVIQQSTVSFSYKERTYLSKNMISNLSNTFISSSSWKILILKNAST
jgi:hypothetical protein